MSNAFICTQCGAPLIDGGCKCEYCGTSFEEPSLGDCIKLYEDNLEIARYNLENKKYETSLHNAIEAMQQFNNAASNFGLYLTPNEMR